MVMIVLNMSRCLSPRHDQLDSIRRRNPNAGEHLKSAPRKTLCIFKHSTLSHSKVYLVFVAKFKLSHHLPPIIFLLLLRSSKLPQSHLTCPFFLRQPLSSRPQFTTVLPFSRSTLSIVLSTLSPVSLVVMSEAAMSMVVSLTSWITIVTITALDTSAIIFLVPGYSGTITITIIAILARCGVSHACHTTDYLKISKVKIKYFHHGYAKHEE